MRRPEPGVARDTAGRGTALAVASAVWDVFARGSGFVRTVECVRIRGSMPGRLCREGHLQALRRCRWCPRHAHLVCGVACMCAGSAALVSIVSRHSITTPPSVHDSRYGTMQRSHRPKNKSFVSHSASSSRPLLLGASSAGPQRFAAPSASWRSRSRSSHDAIEPPRVGTRDSTAL